MASKKSGFDIKRPGKLTAQAHREGKTVHQVAEEDAKSSNPLLKKEGVFALNAEKDFGKKKRGTSHKGVPTKADVKRAKRKKTTNKSSKKR